MAQLSIHVDQLAADDWVVREKGGRELGHYPSQREAEDVGRLVARKRKAVLLVNGRSDTRESESRGWFARLFGR
jgi:uncharacterized protein DUF2188